MKKKFLAIVMLLLMVFCFTQPIVVHAEDRAQVADQTTADKLREAEENANLVQRFFIGIASDFIMMPGVSTLSTLVFYDPHSIWGVDKTNETGVFSDAEITYVIKPLMSMFAGAFIAFVTGSILVSSLRMSLKAYSPQARADFWNDIWMWVIAGIFMGTFWQISEILFSVNIALRDSIGDVLTRGGINKNAFSIIASANGTLKLGDIFVWLAEWGLSAFMNVIYVARKVVILLLMIMSPVAAYSLLFAKTRAFFGTWFKEFAGNIFLQSIHAIVIGLFAFLARDPGAGMLFKLGLLIMFIPVTGMVSKWLNLGDSSSAIGRAATMTGLAGVGGAIMLAKGARGLAGSGGASGLLGASMGAGGAGGDMSSDTGVTGMAAASGAFSPNHQRLKSFARGAGAVAGATMGLPLGGAGMMAGAAIGGKLGESIPAGIRNAAAGSAGLQSAFATASAARNGAGMDADAKRQFYGQVGESLGTMVGFGAAGRELGLGWADKRGASQADVLSKSFGNRTLGDVVNSYPPGSNFEWRQDNKGSALYQNGTRISPLGKADPTLKNGTYRSVPYQSNDGSEWTMNANGTVSVMKGGDVETGGGRSVTVGFSGSTENFARTGNASIVGVNGTYEDTNFKAGNVNVASYYGHNISGNAGKRSGVDPSQVAGWTEAKQHNDAMRHTNAV